MPATLTSARTRTRGFARVFAIIAAAVLLAGGALALSTDPAAAGPRGAVACRVQIGDTWHYGEVPHYEGMNAFEVCEEARERARAGRLHLAVTNGHQTTVIVDEEGHAVPTDQPVPAVIYDSQRPWAPRGVYNETRPPGVAETSATQPVSPVPADGPSNNVLYMPSGLHRAVCDADGCFREYLSGGEWRRSGTYGTGTEALRQAGWNAYWRSRGEPLAAPGAIDSFPHFNGPFGILDLEPPGYVTGEEMISVTNPSSCEGFYYEHEGITWMWDHLTEDQTDDLDHLIERICRGA